MSLAEFILMLCLPGKCIESDGMVQVSVPPGVVSYTRPIEHYPRATIHGVLYVLVPESQL